MRILHVSDFHLKWFPWLTREASRFELVALTGDILNLGYRSPDAAAQIDFALTQLRSVPGRLALCSGNHDQDDTGADCGARWMELLRRENVWIDGDTFQHSGFRFRCIGWSDPVHWAMRNEIVLMHAPPFSAKTSMVAGGVSFGDEAVREVCLLNSPEAPAILLGGHVHCPLRFWDVVGRTVTLNPGQGNDREIPNHIIVDLDEFTAEHRVATASGIRSTTSSFKP